MLRARASTIRRHGGGSFGREAFRVGRTPAGDLSALAGERSLFGGSAAEKLARLQAELEPLSKRYDVVVANPPYMGSSSLGKWMGKWVKDEHPNAYRDLCTSFIERGFTMSSSDGFSAMVTMQSWMFLGSFEKLRGMILRNHSIATMAHLGTRAFSAIDGEVVSTTATVFSNAKSGAPGAYFRLVDMGSESEKKAGLLEALANPDCGWFYRRKEEAFSSIPKSPIAYWVSDSMVEAFRKNPPLSKKMRARDGMHTCNNNLFLRFWWEPGLDHIGFGFTSTKEANTSGKTWFPYNKGGHFRKWIGNDEYVVNWKSNGEAIKSVLNGRGEVKAHGFNDEYGFIPSLTWSSISSGRIAIRNKPAGFMFDAAGYSMFPIGSTNTRVVQAFCNSTVAKTMLDFLSPTLNYQAGDILSMAFEDVGEDSERSIDSIVTDCRELTTLDWNAFETSWGFQQHPLI